MTSFVPVGRFSRLQGQGGELILKTYKPFPEGFDPNKEPVFIPIDGDEDDPVPFFVATLHSKRKGTLALSLEDVDSSEEATPFIGLPLLFPADRFPEQEASTGRLVLEGYQVVDEQKGVLGTVTAVVEHPGNPVLQVGEGENEILIPINSPMILEVDEGAKVVRVDLPEGLVGVNQ